VEAYYDNETDGRHLPDMAFAPDARQVPRSIVNPLSNMGAHVSGNADTPAMPAQKDAPPSLPITAGLGDKVNELVALSPSLQNDLNMLDEQKWEIRYTEPGDGKGSYARRDTDPPHIVIDRRYQENPSQVTKILAHEVGHATYDYTPDYSTEVNYVNGTLADEGMATITNIRVQREIITNGGPDIGVAGPQTQDEYDFYNKTYDNLQSGRIDTQTARNAIGETFRHKKTSTTGKTYQETHGEWYREKYQSWLEVQRGKERRGDGN